MPLEGLGHLKDPIISSRIEPATLPACTASTNCATVCQAQENGPLMCSGQQFCVTSGLIVLSRRVFVVGCICVEP
jgi:hypothetical protein